MLELRPAASVRSSTCGWRPAPVHAADDRTFEEGREPIHTPSLYFLFHDLGGIRKTLTVTPAVATRVPDELSSIRDLAGLAEAVQPKLSERGLYEGAGG
jgi:hypothetical protein